jgi:hypothetical protein
VICLARTQRANFHQGGSWGIWKESEGRYFRFLAILGWGVLPRHRSKATRFHRAFRLKDSKPFEYASYQFERGQLESAAETIEQDKMLIWSEIMYGPRTVVGRLRKVDPGPANRLRVASISQALEVITTSISAQGSTGSPLYVGQDHHDIEPQKIQDLSDFRNLMKAIQFRTLQNATSRGPIIIINHCHWRCESLIVFRDSLPSLIPTTERFHVRANVLVTRLRDAGNGHLLQWNQISTGGRYALYLKSCTNLSASQSIADLKTGHPREVTN